MLMDFRPLVAQSSRGRTESGSCPDRTPCSATCGRSSTESTRPPTDGPALLHEPVRAQQLLILEFGLESVSCMTGQTQSNSKIIPQRREADYCGHGTE